MVDLGFSGPRYTWTNKRDINNLILERIDRFFMNPEWCMLHLEAKITHLPRCHFDHCLVLLETNPGRTASLIRPFRFQEFWLLDTSFPSIISKAWNNSKGLAKSIDSFSKEATLWNKNHFGNIHYKEKRILARLCGIQKALSNNPCAPLLTLES